MILMVAASYLKYSTVDTVASNITAGLIRQSCFFVFEVVVGDRRESAKEVRQSREIRTDYLMLLVTRIPWHPRMRRSRQRAVLKAKQEEARRYSTSYVTRSAQGVESGPCQSLAKIRQTLPH